MHLSKMMIEVVSVKGLVFNIQPFSIHDGEGIRTTVFLKGCPLRCSWCANPESQRAAPELSYIRSNCIQCGECRKCENGAIVNIEENGKIKIDVSKFENAEHYRNVCPAEALTVMGKYMTVDEVIQTVEKDSFFYRNSFGGMTLSGGEPLLQADFAEALLKEARHHYIDTNIETTGYAKYENIYKVFRHLDSIIYDIKIMDDKKHRFYTGVSNKIILDNFKKMRNDFGDIPVLVRTPVIPGVNDNVNEIKRIKEFISGFPNVSYELLKFHRFGVPKYAALGRKYYFNEANLDEHLFEELKDAAIL